MTRYSIDVTMDRPIRLTQEHLAGALPARFVTMVADVGGTTFDVEVTRGDQVWRLSTGMAGRTGRFEQVTAKLLAQLPRDVRPDLCIVGSTGVPSQDGRSVENRANLWWGHQPAADMESVLGCPVAMFNDLQLSVGAVASRDVELLTGPSIDPGEAVGYSTIVLNHGTCLGVGKFVSLGDELMVDSSEEGHNLLAVILDDPEEVAMAHYLWPRVIRRVSRWGIAIPLRPMMLESCDALRLPDLYLSLADAGFTQPSPGALEQVQTASDPTSQIVRLARLEYQNPGSGDALALHCMRKWVQILARFAAERQYGNFPRLVLSGENVNFNRPYLDEWFRQEYLTWRCPHWALSESRTVQICTDKGAVFKGGRILASYFLSR